MRVLVKNPGKDPQTMVITCGEDGEDFADINEHDLVVLQTFFSLEPIVTGGDQ